VGIFLGDHGLAPHQAGTGLARGAPSPPTFWEFQLNLAHVVNLTGKAISDIIPPVDETVKRESGTEDEQEKFSYLDETGKDRVQIGSSLKKLTQDSRT